MKNEEIGKLLQQCRAILDTTHEEKSDALTPPIDAVSLVKFLGKALEDHALTILPQGNFVASPLSNHQKTAFTESLKLFQLIQSLSSQGGLKKPLVFILPVVEAEKVVRWITCVILPKNYEAPAGKPTGNTQGEVAYYLDASVTDNSEIMPACFTVFYQLITKGFTQRVRQGDQIQMKFTAPCLPKGMFYNGSRKQQSDAEESFLWAAYNALHVVFEGSAEFANRFPEANSVVNAKLNTLWHSLLVPTLPILKTQADEKQALPQKQQTPVILPSITKVETLSGNHSSMIDKKENPARKSVSRIEEIKDEIKPDTPRLENSPQPKVEASSSLTPSQVNSHTVSPLSDNETKEEKVNTLSGLPAYDFTTIHTVLHAYGIASSLEERGTTSHTPEWDTLIQSPSSITRELLLKENLDYLLNRKEKAGNRRLCLLLSTSRGTVLALVFEYSGWVSAKAEQWRQLLAQHAWVASNDIFTSPDAINLARQLYTQVRCSILFANGNEPEQSLIQLLREPLARAFDVTPHIHFHYFPSTLTFTDACRKLMAGKFDATETPELIPLLQQDHLQCISTFLDNLNKVTPVSLREKIFEHLTVMSKYMLLENTRRQLETLAGEPLTSSLTKVEILLLQDPMVKRFYYQQAIQLKECLKLLDLSKVISLLKLLETSPETLETQLMTARNIQKQSLQQWEKKWKDQKKILDRQWRPYLTSKGKKALLFPYRYSSVGLGGELCGLVAQGIAQENKEESFFTETKAHLQEMIKTPLHKITRSSRWAQRGSELTGRLLSEANVIFSVRVVGAGLGTLYTLWSWPGWYSSVRPMGVGALTSLVSDFAQSFEKVDDENARVVPAGKGVSYLSQHTLAFRTVSLLVCLIETTYTRNPYYFVGGLGGMSGTLLLTTLMQKELKQRPKKPLKEEEALALFLASQLGYALGQSVVGSFYAILSTKLQSREQAVRYLQAFEERGDYQELHIRVPSMLTHPRLWFNHENPLHVEWRGYDNFYYHRECHAYEVPPVHGMRIGALHCGGVVQERQRLAMAPWDAITEHRLTLTSSGLSSTEILLGSAVGATVAVLGTTFLFKRQAKRTLKEMATAMEGQKKNLYPIAKEIFEHIHITGCLGRLTTQTATRFIAMIQSVITELEKLGIDVDVEKMKQDDQQRLFDEIVHQMRVHATLSTKRCSLARVWQFFYPVIDPTTIEDKAQVIAKAVHQKFSSENNNRDTSENLSMRNLTT